LFCTADERLVIPSALAGILVAQSRLPTLWTDSYFVATVGGAFLAVIKQYIENQKSV
jgi:REP element-mobilizing transposase RayT